MSVTVQSKIQPRDHVILEACPAKGSRQARESFLHLLTNIRLGLKKDSYGMTACCTPKIFPPALNFFPKFSY